jgi:hypothetical protein
VVIDSSRASGLWQPTVFVNGVLGAVSDDIEQLGARLMKTLKKSENP